MPGRAPSSSTSPAELDAKIEVEKDGNRVCGTSIMGLMMLGAAMGDRIVIHARATMPRRRSPSWWRSSRSEFGEE